MESCNAFWYSTPGPPPGLAADAGEVATKWVVSIWILSKCFAFISATAACASPNS
jgi:hypothetical protein